MLVNIHLLGDVDHLFGEILVILQHILVLGVELETFVLEIIPFLDYSLQLLGDGVVNELILDVSFQLMEKFGQLVNLDFIGFDKLLFMLENRLLKCIVHWCGCLLYFQHEWWYLWWTGCRKMSCLAQIGVALHFLKLYRGEVYLFWNVFAIDKKKWKLIKCKFKRQSDWLIEWFAWFINFVI